MKEKTIYFAGGCFWGVEKFMSEIPGVLKTTSGYANSQIKNPKYELVKTGSTESRECVEVLYDVEKISLKTLVFAYFSIIDPTIKNQQGNDIGSQYQTGIYFMEKNDQEVIEEVLTIEKARYGQLALEFQELKNFYSAEEYHQAYLDKNPQGYCHISFEKIHQAQKIRVDAALYHKLSLEEIKQISENPQEEAQDIFVDKTTLEPLFRRKDLKHQAGEWLVFTAPLDPFVIVESQGKLYSRVGNVDLGEVYLEGEKKEYRVQKEHLLVNPLKNTDFS